MDKIEVHPDIQDLLERIDRMAEENKRLTARVHLLESGIRMVKARLSEYTEQTVDETADYNSVRYGR